MSQDKILMIVTSRAYIAPGTPTGLWLDEYAEPRQAFEDAGYEVVTASTSGGDAPIEPDSFDQDAGSARYDRARAALTDTARVADVSAEGFAALFIPGGHGTMFDLPGNPDVGRLLRAFEEGDKVIAAVCHGSAAFVGATRADGSPFTAGRTIAAFTDEEERTIALDTVMPFALESTLRAEGARVVTAHVWADNVQVDGNLVTGQNPQSAASAARAVLALLGARVAA